MEPVLDQNLQKPKSTSWKFIVVILGVFLVVGGSFFFIGQPPRNFVPGTLVAIPQGTSLHEAGILLYDEQVIQSASVFEFVVKMLFPGSAVIAGDFAFDRKMNVVQVAQLVTGGKFGSAQLRVTIPEGTAVVDMATIISRSIPNFDKNAFINQAKPFEGYLFPETYLVFKSTTVEQMVARLKKQYTIKTKNLADSIKQSGRTESQIIIMASLLEKEARNDTEAKIIAGILWKRLDQGKPLQIDAPFLYMLGKTSAQLTLADLQKDGPYNTYTRKGLPKGPIGNPGLMMINAAIHSEPSTYWYYLHDKKGIVHYAVTYNEHLANKKKYLR